MVNRRVPFLILIVFFSIYFRGQEHVVNDDGQWPCSKRKAVEKFELQMLLNPMNVLNYDPYVDYRNYETKQRHVNSTLTNTEVVCAVSYLDPTRTKYVLQEFLTSKEALEANFHVTHQGRCGLCSSTQDLAVYLGKNLTEPVRRCSFLSLISKTLALKCLTTLGFSEPCASIWYYNANNTRKRCFSICLMSWLFFEPFNRDDGSLNDCLQCDEDHSGAVFKFYAGRTRRNSGIVSAIDRPGAEIYNITHCYV